MTGFMVYALTHPETGEIRYIGMTKQGEERIRQHMRPVFLKRKTAVAEWIKSLLRKDLRPSAIELCRPTCWEGMVKAERAWIAAYRIGGANLLNHTSGGEGMRDPSPEVREKLRLANLGKKRPPRSAEWRENLSKALTGTKRGPLPEAQKQKQREFWLNRSGVSMEEIIKRYANGESLRSIEATTGISRCTLSERLRAHGVDVRTRIRSTILARLGKKITENARAKMVSAWARRKARAAA